MIARIWRSRASRNNPEGYPRHFRRNVLPELRAIEGFLGAQLLRRDAADAIEFMVLTRWASMESIRAFAGDETEKAVVEPEAVAALMDFDRTVMHYDIVEEA